MELSCSLELCRLPHRQATPPATNQRPWPSTPKLLLTESSISRQPANQAYISSIPHTNTHTLVHARRLTRAWEVGFLCMFVNGNTLTEHIYHLNKVHVTNIAKGQRLFLPHNACFTSRNLIFVHLRTWKFSKSWTREMWGILNKTVTPSMDLESVKPPLWMQHHLETVLIFNSKLRCIRRQDQGKARGARRPLCSQPSWSFVSVSPLCHSASITASKSKALRGF